jgi:U3 small nucleolar RNA-associated protein 3
MGKKRKASGAAREIETQESSKLMLNSWEDVADSEDEFLINRDKVLLDEGPDAKRRRKLEEEGIYFDLSITE